MLFRLLLVACLALGALAVNRDGCGQRPLASQNRIVNGKEAVPGDWGWQVSLTQSFSGFHFCGGVLINEQWVLTAAHCFQQMPSYLKVDLGLHNRNAKETWAISRKVEKVINHPKFDINRMRNDITMIKLSAPVKLDDLYIIEACLPDADLDVQGKTGWVTGWGAEYFRGQPAIKLMEVAMPILTNDRCKARYGNMVDTASTVCAGEFTVNNGACQGDSGGPFVHQHTDGKWYVVGLTSWGQNGCGFGTIYTRVSYYLDWINEQIANN